ncbi:alanine racemase C-terminal domain-containing protein [Microbacterium sp. Mu-80]|uniref:Alanine racemase C-terminal domain-containing protein n=1 Tax=Microbacterium bandirmense TaxID=3122050 RepID=A0ABU8L7Z0_9MICO
MSSSAAPRVLLSSGALVRNARALLAAGGIADLRHDAYGHGLTGAARIVMDAGATGVLVDGRDEVARLAQFGITARVDVGDDTDPHRLWGIPSTAGAAGAASDPTEPVMCLQGRVLSTKPLHAGEAVSYGYTHRAERDTRVALVTGGYAQGILRALGNRASVDIAGRLRPIVGRIAMDVCVVDLEGDDVPVGTAVTFFGGTGEVRHALTHWSAVSGLTALELAVVIGRHGHREWIA